MVLYQRGLRVLGTRAGGIVLFVWAAVALLGAILLLIVSLLENTFTEAVLAGFTVNLVQAMAFAWPAAFLLWMYPDIELLKDGIKIRFLLLEQHISREEIVKIIKRPASGASAILLRRKGLLLNMLYGLFSTD